LAQLARWLADEHIRLITLVGIGGMGKTRLVQEVAGLHADEFDDGVYLVSLADATDLPSIATAIADAMGFQFATLDEPLQQVRDHLSRKHALLILDNFEHLIGHAAVVSSLLAAAPLCKVIVTSRQRLRLRGETILDMVGMEVSSWHTPDQACGASAVQLFLQSAQQSRPSFDLTAGNLQPITTICALVQGMPLGIELAASWTGTLTLEEIIVGIRNGIGFLESEFQDMAERHRSMRAVLEQSFRLLSDHEQGVFTQLCIFGCGFALDAASAITGANLHTLTAMVNKSLIHRDLEGRYTIHELLRQFGLERLKDDLAGHQELCTRHARFYCQFLSELEHDLISGDAQSACRRIDAEFNNVLLAWDWAVQHDMFDEICAASYALACFREYRCRFLEFDRMYDIAMRRMRQAEVSPRRDLALAEILLWHGWLALRFGQLEQGLEAAEESWELLRRHDLTARHSINGDPRAAMSVIRTLLGDLDTARTLGLELLEFFTARGDTGGIDSACYALTTVELAAGNYDLVRDYGQQGYDACRKINQKFSQSHILDNWANAERALGNMDEAKHLLRESYDNMREVGSSEGQATALTHLAQIALAQGQFDEANSVFAKCAETFKSIGDDGGLAMTLEGRAHVAIAQGHDREAARLLVEAMDITGTKLAGATLSVLTCSCPLLNRANARGMVEQILCLAATHPAANQETRRPAQQQLRSNGMNPAPDTSPSLEQIISQVRRILAAFDWPSDADQPSQTAVLTARELDILRLLAQGLSNSEIAERIVMTVGTIKWYLNQIYAKLGVRNRTEAVIRARQSHLLSDTPIR
jgi:predicted ATPase/DNA-binding CsgD family transcriptional regulator